MIPLCIIEEYIKQVVTKWPEKLWPTPEDELEQLEKRTKKMWENKKEEQAQQKGKEKVGEKQ